MALKLLAKWTWSDLTNINQLQATWPQHALSPQQWRSMFSSYGKLCDHGANFLEKVRSKGIDPRIRVEVWPFLLGVYDFHNTKEERDIIRAEKRKEYDKLRRQCHQILKQNDEILKLNDPCMSPKYESFPLKTEVQLQLQNLEDFASWQQIISLDAVRANGEWIPYSPTQAAVPDERARRSAETIGLKDFDHLEPSRIFHATRLVAILEAYALYGPEIGYCQGMSDLLSPVVAVMSEDHEAFWCFVGFIRKARQNFRLDEVGIKRQLNIVSKIIKFKDSHLYRHLEKLQAEDCFFVYRMVVVIFRRELTFEQTLCLWEVMWADKAAIRTGIWKSTWSKIRLRAPPTEDLLLYTTAALVLQRRKQIVDKCSGKDEILRECNSMAGQWDVWKLLDDAHDLVVTLRDKMETHL